MMETEREVAKKSGLEKVHFRMTDRDVEILGFLLDQKFASLEQLYFRFFDGRALVTDALPPNLHVTRQRLQILRRAGLITTQKVYSEARSLYLLTPFGLQMFRGRKPHEAFATATKEVDFRNYDHDTKVNDCRIALERSGKVMKWLPERRLRMQGFESKYSDWQLPKEVVPDGVFVSSKGERIAFEIETTPRKKSRYEEKRNGFIEVMIGKTPLIHKVVWVGFTDRIFSDLKEVTEGQSDFVIESYSHFLSKLWPKGVPERIAP